MECPIVVTILLLSLAVSLCRGVVLVGEDKRQGLIPFPRVGRTFNPWLPSAAALLRTELDDLQEDVSPYAPDDDVLTVRYTRGLFAPRLGRRKRSLTASEDDSNAIGGKAGHSATSYLDGDELAELGDMLRRTPWAVLAYKNGVDKKMAFSPRLGRAMGSRASHSRMDAEDDGDASAADVNTEKRAAIFAPRLGRSYNEERASLSPRTGRGTPRYVQSRAAAFAPRLGRSDNTAVDSDVRER